MQFSTEIYTIKVYVVLYIRFTFTYSSTWQIHLGKNHWHLTELLKTSTYMCFIRVIIILKLTFFKNMAIIKQLRECTIIEQVVIKK